LEARLASLHKLTERRSNISDEVAELNARLADMEHQITVISSLIRQVRDVGPSAETRAHANAQPLIPTPQAEFLETVRMAAATGANTAANPAFSKTVPIALGEPVSGNDDPAFAKTMKMNVGTKVS